MKPFLITLSICSTLRGNAWHIQVFRKFLFMGTTELENMVVFYKFIIIEIQIFRKNMSLQTKCTDEQTRMQGFWGGEHLGHITNYRQSCNHQLSHLTPKPVIFAVKVNKFKSVLSKMHYNVGNKHSNTLTHI